MIDSDLLASGSLDQLKQGYLEDEERYTCLCCGRQFEKGIIYPENDLLYEAGRYTRLHIETEHQSVFDHLIGLDKSATGLSELQKRLLTLFFLGKSDAEVQKELGIGSTSTIRNHRFVLREKERQARLFLAIMELLRAREKATASGGARHLTVGQEDRSPNPGSPEAKVLKKYFPYGTEGPLQSFSMSDKQKRIILREIVKRFQTDRRYTEQEVNTLLEAVFADYVTLRRYLVDLGFMNRLPDGSQYWRSDSAEGQEKRNMDRKKELQQQAKEIKVEAGVYQIKNTQNGKVFVGRTADLKTISGQRFSLELGSHPNKTMQREWNEFGAEAFAFEVLEVLKRPETGYFDEVDERKKLKKRWLEQLQPFGEKGYHSIGERK